MSGRFFEKLPCRGRLLVLDLGFLGDTVHLLPAVHLIKENFPDLILDVMVAEHVVEILRLAPFIDGVLGYPRFPCGLKWYKNGRWVRELRSRGYDAVVNLCGSERSCLLTRLSGAPLRLGRLASEAKWFKRSCFTDLVDYPAGEEPLYRQRWECLRKVGFRGDSPSFGMELGESLKTRVGEMLGGACEFLHVSPFTTEDNKELPLEVLAGALNELSVDFDKLVISHARNEREARKMEGLKRILSFEPYRMFGGNLNLCELAGVLSRARLHMGGGSGALHVALMSGCPTVSWFRSSDPVKEWAPQGDRHGSFVGEASADGIQGVSGSQVVKVVREVSVGI